MSPRTGRPKLENSKQYFVGVRLDEEIVQKLHKLAELRNETISEVIRKAIEREYKEAQKK